MLAQLIEFIGNHWILFTALVVIIALLTHNFIVGEKGAIDPLAATELINRQDAAVIDVRAQADFAQGHIINAINIPINGFINQTATLSKYKERPVIVTCRSGGQSQVACAILRKAGFTKVHNLRGGMIAWQNANLPLTRKKR